MKCTRKQPYNAYCVVSFKYSTPSASGRVINLNSSPFCSIICCWTSAQNPHKWKQHWSQVLYSCDPCQWFIFIFLLLLLSRLFSSLTWGLCWSRWAPVRNRWASWRDACAGWRRSGPPLLGGWMTSSATTGESRKGWIWGSLHATEERKCRMRESVLWFHLFKVLSLQQRWDFL